MFYPWGVFCIFDSVTKNQLSSGNTFNPLVFIDLLNVWAHATAIDRRLNAVDYCSYLL